MGARIVVLDQVPLPPPVLRRIDGHAKRRVACFGDGIEPVVYPSLIAVDIDLIDQGRGNLASDLAEFRLRDGAQDAGNAKGLCGTKRRRRPFGNQPVETAYGRKEYGKPRFRAQNIAAQRDAADIVQDPGTESDLVQRLAISQQCGLALAAADYVIPVVPVKIFPCRLDQLAGCSDFCQVFGVHRISLAGVVDCQRFLGVSRQVELVYPTNPG